MEIYKKYRKRNLELGNTKPYNSIRRRKRANCCVRSKVLGRIPTYKQSIPVLQTKSTVPLEKKIQTSSTKQSLSIPPVLPQEETTVLDLAEKQKKTKKAIQATLYNLELLAYNSYVNQCQGDTDDDLDLSDEEPFEGDTTEPEDFMDDFENEEDLIQEDPRKNF